LVISRTPYRISFFGGGTDYPSWYLKYGGRVLTTSINKYCYISCRYLPPFFEHRIRVVYSKIENCQTYKEIQHPAVREILHFLELERGLEIHHDGDLPARSGMGSSSSFTVGLLHALYALLNVMPTKQRLATEAIHIEQNLIQETVGSQDQVIAAYGGLNLIVFKPSGDINVMPVTIAQERLQKLNSHLMLFYTGIKRTASDVAKSYVNDIESKRDHLLAMDKMVDNAMDILCSNRCICKFGELLHEAWMLKRGLSSQVSNQEVDGYYEKARANGAIGGKIMGAGGGGFLVLFVPPEAQDCVRQSLKELLYVPVKFESNGSQIIFFGPSKEDFAELDRERAFNNSIKPFRELSCS
jgi:D-glycero-alpha-D-manno-heptose-7-phosphate kinase